VPFETCDLRDCYLERVILADTQLNSLYAYARHEKVWNGYQADEIDGQMVDFIGKSQLKCIKLIKAKIAAAKRANEAAPGELVLICRRLTRKPEKE